MKLITLFALVFTISSCSFDMKKEEVSSNNDDLEFAVDTLVESSDNKEFKAEEQKVVETIVPDEYQAPPISEETAMIAPAEPKFEEFQKPEEKIERFLAETAVDKAPSNVPVEIKINAPEMPQTYGEMETYKVQSGDTMMMIAFKIYGDYRKWKDLRAWNKDIKKVKEGVELKYQVPDSRFGWVPNGLPYLVKTGDTLQVVSMDKYGTTRKWKAIYNNNRPLIRDPNLIFAGFTIYYQPTRELASEKK